MATEGLRRFAVVCTGNGSHGRIEFSRLTLAADGTITEAVTRIGKSPVQGTVVALEDGEPTSDEVWHRAVMPASSHRALNGTWRWKCRRCSIDRPLAESRLRELLRDTPTDVLDVSHLPR